MKKIVKIGFITFIVLMLSGCNKEDEKSMIFLKKINLIENEVKMSALVSMDRKPNIKDLPKTIEIEGVNYELDYMQKFLTIKNFNDKFYCNRTISASVVTSKDNFIQGLRELHTMCEDNNLMIYYEKIGK